MKGPRLSPPCSGWTADLPGPEVVQRSAPDLDIGRINHLDLVYLEIPRPGFKKGILLWFGLLAAFSPVYVGGYVVAGWQDLSVLNILSFAALILPVSIWAFFLFMKWSCVFQTKSQFDSTALANEFTHTTVGTAGGTHLNAGASSLRPTSGPKRVPNVGTSAP